MQSVLRFSFFKGISWYLLVAMVILGVTPNVQAGFIPSEAVTLSPADRAADLQKIQKVLETKMVRQRLTDLGFSNEEIQTRMSQLTDQQLHQFALQLDEMKVAGDSGIGIIIGILVIAILVVILVYLLNHRIVIK
jgi:hypothetical protein